MNHKGQFNEPFSTSPWYGRFISPDDISILDHARHLPNGLNLYAYCGNDPVNNIDPDGRLFVTFTVAFLIGALVAGSVSAGVQYATTGSVDWGVVGIDALFGGLNGLLMVSGIGIVGQIALGGLFSMGNYWAVQGYTGGEITDLGLMFSFGIGAFAGALRGDGLLHGMWKGQTKRSFIKGLEKNVVQTFLHNGFRAGVKTFSTTFGRHFIKPMVIQMGRTGANQLLRGVGMGWLERIFSRLFG